jgi:hypothetical protein
MKYDLGNLFSMPTMTLLCVLYENSYGVEEAPASGIIRCAGNFAAREKHVICRSIEKLLLLVVA